MILGITITLTAIVCLLLGYWLGRHSK